MTASPPKIQPEALAPALDRQAGSGSRAIALLAESAPTRWAEEPTGPPTVALELGPTTLALLERITVALESSAENMRRMATPAAPMPDDIVGTPHVAQQLGCSVVWAAEMARNGQIPKSCIVPGTGNGKPWKFRRPQIDDWLNRR